MRGNHPAAARLQYRGRRHLKLEWVSFNIEIIYSHLVRAQRWPVHASRMPCIVARVGASAGSPMQLGIACTHGPPQSGAAPASEHSCTNSDRLHEDEASQQVPQSLQSEPAEQYSPSSHSLSAA